MTRPAPQTVVSSQQSWDAAVNHNQEIAFDGPFPIKEYANPAALPAAGSYDRCIVATTSPAELWISDGSAWRTLGVGSQDTNGARGRIVVATSLVTLNGNASPVTWAGAKPAGARLIGVSGRITTAATGTGLTDLDIGDGTDVDRFEAAMALALGTTFTPANATADPGGWTAAAGDVVVTGNGLAGNFTAGEIRLVAVYEEVTAPTS